MTAPPMVEAVLVSAAVPGKTAELDPETFEWLIDSDAKLPRIRTAYSQIRASAGEVVILRRHPVYKIWYIADRKNDVHSRRKLT